tara:strand:+ start:6619 stop:7887 length:1269 start_codon:yes stop_codon:yes gene_type:complete
MTKIAHQLRNIGKSPTLQINEASLKREEEGKSVYKFGFGQSPFPIPDKVVSELKNYAHEKSYLPVEGLHKLREAIANSYNNEDVSVSPDNVLIGPGSKELMFILQMVLDCTAIIPSPSWVSYEPQSIILKQNYSFLDTSYNSSWKISPAQLEKKCRERKGLKLLILNYPSNPTGISYSSSELEAIANICRKNNTLILSDEIYSRLHHKNNHKSISKYFPEGTIITSGLSKWCGAGGWRLGIMIMPNNLKSVQNSITKVSSETFSCVSSPIQYAAIAAYHNDDIINDYLLHSRRILSCIGNYCYQALSNAEARVCEPEGGFYLFPDFSNYNDNLKSKNINNSEQLCKKLLKDAGVALLPGSAFGRPSNEFTARLAYVNFNGSEALRVSKGLVDKDQLNIDDLGDVVAPLKSGMSSLVNWLKLI